MKRKNILKPVILVIMTIIALVFFKRTAVINYIKEFTNTQLDIRQITNTENNITTIDVTGVTPGKETQHEHIYKTMYDEEKHWEECIVCSEKRNEIVHSFKTTWASGNESCNSRNLYTNACICGYSETGHKPCVWDGKSYVGNSLSDGYAHARKCSICKDQIWFSYYLNSYGNGEIYSAEYTANRNSEFPHYQHCYSSDGKKLDCINPGVCAICKRVYTGEKHVQIIPDKETKSLYCRACGKEFGSIDDTITRNADTPGTYTITSNVKLKNGATFREVVGSTITDNIWEINSQTKTGSSTEFILTTTLKFKENWKLPVYGEIIYFKININNSIANCRTIPFDVYPDKEKPTILNVTTNNEGRWSKSKLINISGTENWTDTVRLEILNDEGNSVYIGRGNVTNGNYSISCIPELEAGAEDRKFTAIVTDACENSVEQEFAISKIDSVAPEVISVDRVSDGWEREKNITFTASDHGIGNVQIAFNDVSDYELATKNGIEYSREYKLTGDVYKPREANVYYKDELGNISTKKVIINKLDNTVPTITRASFSNNKLNITAHDRHETEGEGSGVSKYRFITANSKLQNPEITINNSTEVLVNEDMIIPDMHKMKYVYVVAEDLVRKCK